MSTPEDTGVWQTIGHNLIQTIVAVTVETFVIAIYSVLVLKTGRLLLRKTRSKVSLYTCTAVFVMFIMAIALWIIDVHNLITEVKMTLLSTSNDSLSDDYAAAVSSILRLASVEDILYSYMTVIGDGIIIWRVYAFWSNGRERLVLLIPGAFLLGSISTSMMLTYCATRLGADIELGTYQHPAFCRNIQTASYSMTLTTTAVATALIAYKSWKYWQMHLATFGSSSPRTRTLKVMAMLIESGIMYMLFFAVQVVMSIGIVNDGIEQSVRLTFALTIEQYISSLIVGIYPTIVVILVHSKHSVLHSKAETADSALVFKQGRRVTSEGATAYLNSATVEVTGKALHVRDRDDELFEMAQVKTVASGESDERPQAENGLKVQVQRSVLYDG